MLDAASNARLAAACSLTLATAQPLLAVAFIIAILSLGYDMTEPPLGGIVTNLPGYGGLAMGLNVCTLFTGIGLGSLAFQAPFLPASFPTALTTFGALALIAAAAAIPLFRSEKPSPHGQVRKSGAAAARTTQP